MRQKQPVENYLFKSRCIIQFLTGQYQMAGTKADCYGTWYTNSENGKNQFHLWIQSFLSRGISRDCECMHVYVVCAVANESL